jgi:hypothetical protein
LEKNIPPHALSLSQPKRAPDKSSCGKRSAKPPSGCLRSSPLPEPVPVGKYLYQSPETAHVLINVQPALSAASMWDPSYASTSTMPMGALASLAAPWILTPRTTILNPLPSLTSTQGWSSGYCHQWNLFRLGQAKRARRISGDGRGGWKASSADLKVLRLASAGIAVGIWNGDGKPRDRRGGKHQGRLPGRVRSSGLGVMAKGGWRLVQDSGLTDRGLSVIHNITLADLYRDGAREIIVLSGGSNGSITVWKRHSLGFVAVPVISRAAVS